MLSLCDDVEALSVAQVGEFPGFKAFLKVALFGLLNEFVNLHGACSHFNGVGKCGLDLGWVGRLRLGVVSEG